MRSATKQKLFAAGLFVVVLGFAVLIGWSLDISSLKSVLIGHHTMKVNTALCLVVSGLAVILLANGKPGPLFPILCYVVIGFSVLTFSQYVFGYDLGIDQPWIADTDTTQERWVEPGRPAPTTLISFILLNVGLLAVRSPRKTFAFIAAYSLHLVTLISFMAMVGYIYRIPVFAKIGFMVSEAVHTAFSFFVLSVSASLLHPKDRFVHLFVGKKPGNLISKRLFIQLIVISLVLGYLILAAYRRGFFSGEFGITLQMVTSILVAFFLIQYSAYALNRVDKRRQDLERRNRKINRKLEKMVNELLVVREKLHTKVGELESANKELATFNFISSHDLQEPLRKLRNFADVLLGSERDNLSDAGKLYLKRMADVSMRMQKLIMDLLAYSSTKDVDRDFEKVNLDEVLNEVLEDLGDVPDVRNAVVIHGPLCEVTVIRSLFSQLLTNLIDNSQKFRHPDRQLQITIECRVEDGARLHTRLLPAEKFSHISFTDNGIGFDVQYSEIIFEIFKRLNEADKYPGTGAGLAICRKIVDIHHGLITAHAEPGKGARFDIYLPVKPA